MAQTTIKHPNSCHIAAGVEAYSVAANSYSEYTINFAHQFYSSPTCAVTLRDSISNVSNAFSLCAWINSVSTTALKVRVYNNTSSSKTGSFHWIAVGGAEAGTLAT